MRRSALLLNSCRASDRAMWTSVVVSLVAAICLMLPIRPHDYWWNMALGREIWQTGAVPQTDSFSFTQADDPYFVQPWLAQLFMFGLYSGGQLLHPDAGNWCVLIVTTLFLAVAYWLLARLCQGLGGSAFLTAVLMIGFTIPATCPNWNVRPQSFAIPLFVLFQMVLYRWWMARDGSWRDALVCSRLWLLPPLMILWANLHGSYVMGCVQLFLAFAAAAAERLLGRQAAWSHAGTLPAEAPASPQVGTHDIAATRPVSGSALAAIVVVGITLGGCAMLHPAGWKQIQFVLSVTDNAQWRENSIEWRTPVWHDVSGGFFFGSVGLLIILVAASRQRLALVEAFWLAGLFYLSLQGVRYIQWFGLAVTPILVRLLSTAPSSIGRARQTTAEPRSLANAVVMAGLLIGVVTLLPAWKSRWLPGRFGNVLERDTPLAATSFLESLPELPQRIFHSSPAGSYLMWRLPPRHVFIDSRLQAFYSLDLVDDYTAIEQGRQVRERLRKYRIDALLVSKATQPKLRRVAEQLPEWHKAFEDSDHIVFLKANSRTHVAADRPSARSAPDR